MHIDHHSFFAALAAVAVLGVPAVPSWAEQPPLWPQFRGPGAMGVAPDDPALPDRWSEDENVVWKVPVPGRGWSSPVVWGDRVFLTAAVDDAEPEAPKPGLYFGGERGKPETVHDWKVLCFDAGTGGLVWEHEVAEGVPAAARHLKNSFASETPATDGERLYAYIGNVGLFAFDRDGALLWSRSWDPVETRHGWGTAASPVVHDGVVYVVNDNEGQSWLAAVDAASGEVRWSVDRDEGSNWSTPFVWQNSQRTELVTTGTGRVRSYDLEGNELWSLTGFSSITVPVPFADGDLLYIGSGYVGDQTRPFMAVRAGAEGDITLPEGATSGGAVAWSHPKAAPYMPTPVLYRGRLYVLLDRGMVSCYDAATGRQLYDRERLGRHGEFNASPLAYNGKIFCFSERGSTVVVSAGGGFAIERVNPLDEMIMATPAVAGGRLFVRTIGHLYCIGGAAAAERP